MWKWKPDDVLIYLFIFFFTWLYVLVESSSRSRSSSWWTTLYSLPSTTSFLICSHEKKPPPFSTPSNSDDLFPVTGVLVRDPTQRCRVVKTNLVLEQDPVDEKRSDVLLFPMKLRKRRGLCHPVSVLIERDSSKLQLQTHPVFHGLLDKSEAFPAWVKLLLVSATEKHEVTDNLQSHKQNGTLRPCRPDILD